LDWLGNAIDEGRTELVAQHGSEREIEDGTWPAGSPSCLNSSVTSLTRPRTRQPQGTAGR
jgi:hypothetical protein